MNKPQIGRAARRRLAVASMLTLLAGGVLAAEKAAAPADSESGFVAWVRSIGHAVGLAFRDIGTEGKRVGLSIGEAAANFGKEVGKGAASAGREVGQAAKEGGKAFGKAITGKGSADKPAGGKESTDGAANRS